jgi:hypothetical protein
MPCKCKDGKGEERTQSATGQPSLVRGDGSTILAGDLDADRASAAGVDALSVLPGLASARIAGPTVVSGASSAPIVAATEFPSMRSSPFRASVADDVGASRRSPRPPGNEAELLAALLKASYVAQMQSRLDQENRARREADAQASAAAGHAELALRRAVQAERERDAMKAGKDDVERKLEAAQVRIAELESDLVGVRLERPRRRRGSRTAGNNGRGLR